MRDMNINVSCAHCGEILDTNEASRNDIDDSGELTSGLELHVGTQHECFDKDSPKFVKTRPEGHPYDGPMGVLTDYDGCDSEDES
jgi:hypothetical protein